MAGIRREAPRWHPSYQGRREVGTASGTMDLAPARCRNNGSCAAI